MAIGGSAPSRYTAQEDELNRYVPLKFLPVTNEIMVKINKKYQGCYYVEVLKAGAFSWLQEDVPQLGWTLGRVTRKDVPIDVVYAWVMTAFDIKDQYEKMYSGAKGMEKMQERTMIDMIDIPLHTGAVMAYRKLGITVPDRLIPPEMK